MALFFLCPHAGRTPDDLYGRLYPNSLLSGIIPEFNFFDAILRVCIYTI